MYINIKTSILKTFVFYLQRCLPSFQKVKPKTTSSKGKGVFKENFQFLKKHLGAFGTTSLYLKAQPVYTPRERFIYAMNYQNL